MTETVNMLVGSEIVVVDMEDWLALRHYSLSIKYYKNNYKVVRFGRGPLVGQSVSRFIMKTPDNLLVDHINGNTLNLTKANMRFATRAQNSMNHLGTSGRNLPKGVTNNGNSYGAQITVKGKRIWLGTFKTCQEAERVYRQAAEKHFGEFAAHLSRGETE